MRINVLSGVLACLATMPQIMVRQHNGHHRLANGHGANADAGIVTPFCDNLRIVAILIDAAARIQD
jgi:hypothetical protein